MAELLTTERDKILGSVQLEVESLIQGRQTGDPRLYEAVLLLNRQLEVITRQLSPLVRKSLGIISGVSELLAPVNFICFSTKITVRFTWDQVTYASQYEVREGTSWNAALFRFRTSGLQGNIDPLLYGNYTFLIKTLDSEGKYSETANAATIDVHFIAPPTISVSVIDNNVLLYWTEPISVFKIDYYIVKRLGAGGDTSGKVDGTFTSFFEVVAGFYEYAVIAVDIAGNVGDEARVGATVATPPDYGLQDNRISALNGTRFNLIRLPIRPSLLCCWPGQTWQEHFIVLRSWLDPQDQVDTGYPIYIQPTAVTGWYEEIIDYGTVINNVIVSITWNTIVHVPQFSTNIVVTMYTATVSGEWSAASLGSSQYFRSLRYLKFRLDFTSENDKALIEVYNLTVSLAAKRENDGGEVNALSTDSGGTIVYFTKPFKDIESITCTTKSVTEPFTVIFDFLDIPDPVSFRVYVFDTMGARVTKLVDWKARGIV